MRRALAFSCASILVFGGCTCLDLTTARDYPCLSEGGPAGQCPDGYRCGLENRCHEVGLAQSWQCADDNDCEASWRCGPQGYCLDPAAEALAPTDAGNFTASRVGPPLPLGLPAAVEHARDPVKLSIQRCPSYYERAPDLPDGGFRDDLLPHYYGWADVASELQPTGFYKVLHWQWARQTRYDGGLPQLNDCDGGTGVPLRDWPLDVVRAPAPPTAARSMVDDGTVTYVLAAGGVLCTYALSSDLALARDCQVTFDSKADPDRLRGYEGSYHRAEYLLAFNAEGYQILSVEDGGLSPVLPVVATDGTYQQINDLIAYDTPSQPLLVAATPRGLYAHGLFGVRISDGGQLGPFEWEPVAGAGPLCETEGASSSDVPVGLGFVNEDELLVQHHVQNLFLPLPADQDAYRIVKSDYPSFYSPPPGCVFLPSKAWDQTFTNAVAYASPCPHGARALWARIASEQVVFETGSASRDPFYKAEVRCRDAANDFTVVDATGTFFPSQLGSTVTEPLPPSARFHRPVRASANSIHPALADDLGHLWLGDGSRWALQPLVLDAAPGAVFQGGREVGATRAREMYGKLNDVRVVLDSPTNFEELSTGYLAGADTYYPATSTVAGRPSWTVVDVIPPSRSHVLATFERLPPGGRDGGDVQARAVSRVPETLLFGEPYLAAAVDTPTGRTVEVMTSFDTLLAVDVTDQIAEVPSGAFDPIELFSTPEAEVKLIAMNRTPIQSLVLLDPDTSPDAGAFVEGYMLQASRVFHLSAPNFTVWRSNEIVLEDTTEPLEVFADGRRGRVGMKSGAVYSLPSRLKLAGPLPVTAGEVSDYVERCGNLFALADGGLFYLRAGDSPVGTWEEIPIDVSVFPMLVREYRGGKISATRDALHVYLRNGLAATVTGFKCP